MQTLEVARRNRWLLDIALDQLSLARAALGLALSGCAEADQAGARRATSAAREYLDGAVAGLRATESNDHLPDGLLARARFRRVLGDSDGAARDLDEAEEVAEPGPMRLYLCDMALERARLSFAGIEAFAPLNGLLDDSPPKPETPDATECVRLRIGAKEQIDIAAKYIDECGYHLRDEELAELRDVLAGKRSFASLPPHV